MKEIRQLPFMDRTYELYRKQVKRINLRIRQDGSIYVSANPLVPMEGIEKFLCAQEQFIKNALERQRGRTSKFTMAPSDDGQISILGKTYHVIHTERKDVDTAHRIVGNKTSFITMTDDTIYVVLPDQSLPSRIETLWKAFWKTMAQPYMEALARQVHKEFTDCGYKVPHPTISVREMTSRWGSCTPLRGRITMNTKLMWGEERFVHYVMVHEFSHFIEANHSDKFYKVMEAILPQWKKVKEDMRQYFQD